MRANVSGLAMWSAALTDYIAAVRRWTAELIYCELVWRVWL